VKRDPFEALSLTHEQRQQLADYEALLRSDGVPLGLVSRRDLPRLAERHLLDSLRALRCLPDGALEIIDLGSGAGFPGIPVAIGRPDSQVHLVEPKQRRAAFLELAIERLRLPNTSVETVRAEDCRHRAHIVLARAMAAPAVSWRLGEPLLRPGGALVYFAGGSWSKTDEDAVAGLGAISRICDPASEVVSGPLVMMCRSDEPPRQGLV
jgi:16S rRNA (guanine527-N7)-methyltransferase